MDLVLDLLQGAGIAAAIGIRPFLPVLLAGALAAAPDVLANYDVALNTAAFTITPKPASVTPASATKTYGAADPAFTGTLTGFLAADDVKAAYGRRAGEAVGTFPIEAKLSSATAGALANYQVTAGAAEFTITRKSASVTPTAATKVYGAQDPTFTGTLEGFLPGDNVTATYTRAAGENVGTYAISAAPTAAAGVLANYDVTSGTANLTITKKAASVTPAAGTKVYGTNDPALSGQLEGFLTADNVTAAYSRAAGETVGNYPIAAALSAPNGSALANYEVATGTASFTITKAPLTITAPTLSREYGDPNPAFPGTADGAKFNDSFTVTGSTTATPTSPVAGGPYAITPAVTGEALANYDVTKVDGKLTITKATLTITPANVTKTYGDAATLTGNITGQKNGDIFGASYASAGSAAAAPVGTGSYPITVTTVTGSQLANYTESRQVGTLTVNKRPVTAIAISSETLVRAYTGAGLGPTATSTPAAPLTLTYYQDAQAVGAGTVSATGVYRVVATLNEPANYSYAGPAVEALFVIYDPSGGFVTGGGWITSPTGAYVANPSATGKANFGFVSKYQPGAKVPSGNTEFQFHAAGMNFKSTAYEWLTVAGARAQYKGEGTINGTGAYGFMLTAIDGSINGGGGTDKFRIKIWNKASGAVVYDNQVNADDAADPTTVIGGGSIQIKTK